MTAVLDLDVPRQWHFTIPDAPVAAARPRVAVRGGRPHGYMPARTAQAAWRIREHVTAALGASWAPLSGPLALAVVVYLPMPASIPKRERSTARPERRPDLDNYVKTAMDGLSPLWSDDAQVVELHAEKRYAVDSAPRWEIAVESLIQPALGASAVPYPAGVPAHSPQHGELAHGPLR
ncbi:MAG TPA: RusA family crossover junction endodeoxyribonuclease [Candidatus Saccharimonadales bacterium]|nr:RusA family crossover junction endodeoxyribonuclease [Candidatus Saccharimonadales bacterium]